MILSVYNTVMLVALQITKHNIMLVMIHPVLSASINRSDGFETHRHGIGVRLFLPRQLLNQIRFLSFIDRSILAENIMEP
jgi:hypothetical protein